ncbi:MAG: adenylate/guanylate cyclase domain-containing protein, partial [Bacteroidota bacterium]
MICPSCGFDNPPGMKFCGGCAAPLKNSCPRCGFDNPSTFKFCGGCGNSLIRDKASPEASITGVRRVFGAPDPDRGSGSRRDPLSYTPSHLVERILHEQAAIESRATVDGERKTITALFADIKGSMELIEDLDPEEARSIVDPVLHIMMNAVHRYEGYVAQSLGDGIFALFGAPIAQEDHPHRAVYAALRMQEESRRYAERLRLEKGVNIQIRVGINTGEVVVRSIRKDDLHTDYVPVGHSTGLAARAEALATPGSVVATEHTKKLTEGFFQFVSMGRAQ